MNPGTWVFVIILLPFIFFGCCTSIDTITPNQSIKDGDHSLVSNGETFALGFFSLGNSTQRYVGIWYNKISVQTVVWIANRDKPINGSAGVLSMNQDGNLTLYNKNTSELVWHASVSAAEKVTNSSYSARLLDTGNLVLFRGDNGSFVAWQSFDYPSHAMLPNMKLGLDRRTGQDRFLTSWKSPDDPGMGAHSYRMDPNGAPQLVLHKGSVRLWRTGPWIGGKWSGVAEMSPDYIFSSSYVDNNDELSVMYGLNNASFLSFLFVDELGYVQRITWDENGGKWVKFWSAPKDPCDSYNRCGPYGDCDPNNGGAFECICLPGYEPRSASEWYLRDGLAGCMRKQMALSMCGNGEGFVKVAQLKIPDTTTEANLKLNMSMEECNQGCLRNCSCSAYTSGSQGECIKWYGNLTDTRAFTNGGSDLYIRVDAIEFAQQSKKTRRIHAKTVAIVMTSILVMLLLIISSACWLVKKRTKGRLNNIQTTEDDKAELPTFDAVTISLATNNFSDTNKIGQGGFGPVYKGQLSTGKEIPVKRLSTNSKQGFTEFKNEIILIAKLQHRNLVRLLGCCIYGEERMLIYEYMPNGSLDSFIFGPGLDNTRSKSLTWRKRLDIIVGIARGLLYLHQDSRLRIIHRDLKASNVLLDCEMNPKISDFGLARVFGGDQSSAITDRVVGTHGYMSPEYAVDGLFSMKSDVFSFGVSVLEILSGQRNRLFRHPDHNFNLLGHAWKLWVEGKASEVLDPLVEGSVPISEVLRCIQVGLLCVQKYPEDRPTMSSVLLMLITETVVPPQPKQPGFYTERNPNKTVFLQSAESPPTPSINEMTMTRIQPR